MLLGTESPASCQDNALSSDPLWTPALCSHNAASGQEGLGSFPPIRFQPFPNSIRDLSEGKQQGWRDVKISQWLTVTLLPTFLHTFFFHSSWSS